MTDLRKAAEAALNLLKRVPCDALHEQGCTVCAAETALRAALAEPEQEPVALGAEWTPCMKLPVVVHVRNQRPGESHVSTREGITPVKPDDLIMRGVHGEEYPIGRAIFVRTYTLEVEDSTRPATPLSVERIRGLADKVDEGQEPSEYLVSLVRAVEQMHNIGGES